MPRKKQTAAQQATTWATSPGQHRPDAQANQRDGASAKTVITERGPVQPLAEFAGLLVDPG